MEEKKEREKERRGSTKLKEEKRERRETLRVRFTEYCEVDASEIGRGGGGGGEGGEGRGEAGGEAMILYTSLKRKFGLQTNIDINSSLY